jgi:hypothetical protein
MISQRKQRWKRILKRYFIQEENKVRRGRLPFQDKWFRALGNVEIQIHVGSTIIIGTAVRPTADCLMIRIARSRDSVAFVDWEGISAIEIH